jgi:hypothetical protein
LECEDCKILGLSGFQPVQRADKILPPPRDSENEEEEVMVANIPGVKYPHELDLERQKEAKRLTVKEFKLWFTGFEDALNHMYNKDPGEILKILKEKIKNLKE